MFKKLFGLFLAVKSRMGNSDENKIFFRKKVSIENFCSNLILSLDNKRAYICITKEVKVSG
jgi:hypothetical protein